MPQGKYSKNLKASGKPSGPYVIPVGFHCNCHCLFCYNRGGASIRPQLGLQQIYDEMAQAVEKGYGTVALFGGESTVEPYFFDLLEHAKQLGLKVRLETNAHAFAEPGFIERLKDYPIDSCQFSFHSSEEAVHDELTQTPGAFRKVIKGILNFKKHFPDIRPDSYTVITSKNYQELYRTACYLHKFFDVRQAFFSFLIPPADRNNFKGLAVSFRAVEPHLKKALAYLSGQQVPFRIDKCPVCVFHEHYESHHYEHGVFDPQDYCKHPVCASCPYSPECMGFSKQYVEEFGFEGLTLGGLAQKELPFFFAGLDMRALKNFEDSLSFDDCNNLVLTLEHENKEWKEACRDANIPLCYIKDQDRLIDVWGDFQHAPEVVQRAVQNEKVVSVPELTESICRQIRDDFKTQIRPENILLTAGSRAALYGLFLALIRRNDRVILRKGMWDGYRYGIEQAGGRAVEISEYADLQKIPLDGVRCVIVNNPQLPSVRARLDDAVLKSLIDFCNERGIVLLLDEIGNRLSPDPFSALSLCDLATDRVIVTQSFSKNYFMPQYRAGYMVAHSEMIRLVKNIIEFSRYEICLKAVQAAYAVLNSPQDWQKERAALVYAKGKW